MLNRREFLQAAALGGTAIGLVGCGSAAGNDAATPVRDTDAAATTEPVAVRTAALKGPTAMGMVQFMDGVDKGEIADYDYDFQIVASVDEVTPNLVQGNVDSTKKTYDETEEVVDTFKQVYFSAEQLREIADELVSSIDYFKMQ